MDKPIDFMSEKEFGRHRDDHEDSCYLQPPLTIPSWCTCNTFREHRIQRIVNAVFFRVPAGGIGHYWEQIKPDELREAIKRIRAEKGHPNVDLWYGDHEENPHLKE